MWIQLHDGDGFPLFVNMDNVVDFRWFERERYTCLLTKAPVAEKLHRLYVRESATEIMGMIHAEQRRRFPIGQSAA